ncbi:hypothetical protein BaRGS_00039242, partial [Batillaria attramentaria]
KQNRDSHDKHCRQDEQGVCSLAHHSGGVTSLFTSGERVNVSFPGAVAHSHSADNTDNIPFSQSNTG